jgi:hypothetical protein
MRFVKLLLSALPVVLPLIACAAGQADDGAPSDGDGNPANPGAPAGVDAGPGDASGQTDASPRGRADAAKDGTPDALPPPPDAGPVTCPTSPSSRTVGAHRSALPSLTWWGAGYTAVIDEVVTESPFVTALTVEKSDATGVKLAGPLPITPLDGTMRLWPRVAFSGWEYGVTFLEGNARVPRFLRVDASLAPIAGSGVTVSGAEAGAVAVAWSQGMWAVTWSDASNTGQISLQRFDSTGALVGPVLRVGPGWIGETGTPLIATPNGWALVATGFPGSVYEISSAGDVRSVPLPFSAGRAAIATDGSQYLVVASQNGGQLVRVQMGGGVVPGTQGTFGTVHADSPDAVWNGKDFVLIWSETTANVAPPLSLALVPPTSMGGPQGGAPTFSQGAAMFPHAVSGSCGWAVVYGSDSATALASFDVHP